MQIIPVNQDTKSAKEVPVCSLLGGYVNWSQSNAGRFKSPKTHIRTDLSQAQPI